MSSADVSALSKPGPRVCAAWRFQVATVKPAVDARAGEREERGPVCHGRRAAAAVTAAALPLLPRVRSMEQEASMDWEVSIEQAASLSIEERVRRSIGWFMRSELEDEEARRFRLLAAAGTSGHGCSDILDLKNASRPFPASSVHTSGSQSVQRKRSADPMRSPL